MVKDIIDVSIVITVYNIEKYISECLDSILSQKEKNIEVICVDDASTDFSLEILQRYEKQDERVKIIAHQKNKGVGSARNAGCRAARGRYLYIIDGDDLSVEGSISRLYDIASDNHLDVLTFEAEAFWEDNLEWTGDKVQGYRRKGSYEGIHKGAEIFSRFIKNHDTTGNTCLNFINREFFSDNGLYWTEGIRQGLDDSVFAIYMAAQRVMCISDVLYKRRYRPKSLVMSSMKRSYLPGMLIQFMHELDIWDEYGSISQEDDKWIENYFKMMYADINKVYELTKHEQKNEEWELLKISKKANFFYTYCVMKQPLFLECIAEEDLENVMKADRVVIYGAGRYGNLVAETLEYYGIVDYEIAVSRIGGKEDTLRGKRVKSIVDLKLQKENTVVIIAAGHRLRGEMVDALEKTGGRNYVFCREL